MENDDPWWGPVLRALRAAAAFIGHICLAIIIITGIWSLENYIHYLWEEREPMLFDRVPLKWLFDAVDLSILLVFAVWGTIEANRKLKG
jgi:hypothetical protein